MPRTCKETSPAIQWQQRFAMPYPRWILRKTFNTIPFLGSSLESKGRAFHLASAMQLQTLPLLAMGPDLKKTNVGPAYHYSAGKCGPHRSNIPGPSRTLGGTRISSCSTGSCVSVRHPRRPLRRLAPNGEWGLAGASGL